MTTAQDGRVAGSAWMLVLLGVTLACGCTEDSTDGDMRDATIDMAAAPDAPADATGAGDSAPLLTCLEPDCVAGIYTVERHVERMGTCSGVAETPVVGEPVFYINPHSFQGRRVRLSLDWCEDAESCVFRDNVSPFDWVWFPDNDPNADVRETSTEEEVYDEAAQSCAARISDFRLTAPSEGTVRIETIVYHLALGDAPSIDACLDLQRDTPLEVVRETGACVRTETVEGRFSAELP